jgi:energy-converting hydrogenase Eha subunit F
MYQQNYHFDWFVISYAMILVLPLILNMMLMGPNQLYPVVIPTPRMS